MKNLKPTVSQNLFIFWVFIFTWFLYQILTIQKTFAKIPQHWIASPQNQNASLFLLQTTQINSSTRDKNSAYPSDFAQLVANGYATINPSLQQKDDFGIDKNVDHNTNSQQLGPWYLNSVTAQFGVEASGIIGFLGYRGSSALSMTWERTPASLLKLQKNHWGTKKLTTPSGIKNPSYRFNGGGQNGGHAHLSLSSTMSQYEVIQHLENLVTYIENHKIIEDPGLFQKQLTAQVLQHQKGVQQLSLFPENLAWQPTEYTLQLYVKAGGQVFPTLIVGAVMQIEIVWEIKPNFFILETSFQGKSQTDRQPAPIILALEKVSHHLQKLKQLDQSSTDSLYQLTEVELGLGIFSEGDFEIAQYETSVIGVVSLKPTSLTFQKNNLIPENSVMTTNFVGDPMIGGVSQDQWAAGLREAGQMAQSILKDISESEKEKDLHRPHRDFQLQEVEIQLSLTAGGAFLLPTVAGTTLISLEYEKINPAQFYLRKGSP